MVNVATFSVFRKTSPNGKVTLYVPQRDIVDHYTHIDPIDGVLVVDPLYFKERLIFGQVVVTLRYGREEDEVMGLEFSKKLFLVSEQVHPKTTTEGGSGLKRFTGSRVHERLLRKLGPYAVPFRFEIPMCTPSSVTIQQGIKEVGPPCGVDYELKFYVAQSADDRGHKRSAVTLGIRKVQYAPTDVSVNRPCTVVRKDFLLSPGQLELEVDLDKQLYYHGESVGVNMSIRNHSNKVVKKIRVSVVQMTDINLFSNGQYKLAVSTVDTQDGCPVISSSNLQKVVHLTPSLDENRDRRGVALDGKLKHQNTNLASSTLSPDPEEKDAFGIFVSYVAKVRLYLGALGGELTAELPFLLMHPKPTAKRAVLLKGDSQADVEHIMSSRQNTIESIDDTPSSADDQAEQQSASDVVDSMDVEEKPVN